jgi:GNAT superfamily N-acetyltransferase
MSITTITSGTALDPKRVTIAELGEGDRALIHDHLIQLGRAERVRRFQAPLSDVALGLHVGRIDFDRTIVIGALAGRRRLIGLAEAEFDGEVRPAVARISVTVDPAARGQGLGRRLVGLVIEQAFARGAFAVEFEFTPGDRPIARIAAALGARVDPDAGYAALSRATLAPAA